MVKYTINKNLNNYVSEVILDVVLDANKNNIESKRSKYYNNLDDYYGINFNNI